MPGLDPGIHALGAERDRRRPVDGRDEPGHDGEKQSKACWSGAVFRHREERSDKAIRQRRALWVASLRSHDGDRVARMSLGAPVVIPGRSAAGAEGKGIQGRARAVLAARCSRPVPPGSPSRRSAPPGMTAEVFWRRAKARACPGRHRSARVSAIGRSAATKRSTGARWPLDCFAALAKTEVNWGRWRPLCATLRSRCEACRPRRSQPRRCSPVPSWSRRRARCPCR
ncbi:hypothetical protein SLNSH_19890 [Alsobacter soli]|uniref:Uncharacterized protein n=1 Tax=Alsobacter soli TaxID=2109933 RepID=A0A2T1HNI7_9HYPH|nr:hypothetical protein SLNSH_19890 [Alsobacter soli]